MTTYKGPCQHGYSEKCPTCQAWEEEQEMDDTIQGYQREIAALKAKIAAYEKALSMDTPYRDQATALSAARVEIAALKAELARYTGPLTDEQADDAYDRFEQGGLPLDNILYAQAFDKAVRAIRAARERGK